MRGNWKEGKGKRKIKGVEVGGEEKKKNRRMKSEENERRKEEWKR